MFHDLNSPFVAAGLDAFAAAGWKTGIYETMQIMGIAWRGDYIPLVTARDPTVPLKSLASCRSQTSPSHLNPRTRDGIQVDSPKPAH